MQRRQFLSLFAGGTIGSPLAAPAQQEEAARLRNEIEETRRQLAETRQQKMQLLCAISEMRAPLFCMLGYTELMLDAGYGEVPESVRFALDRVRRIGIDANGLINAAFAAVQRPST
jgi:signal transduction histidine kinase